MKTCKFCKARETEVELSDECLCFGCLQKQRDRLLGGFEMTLKMCTNKTDKEIKEFLDLYLNVN